MDTRYTGPSSYTQRRAKNRRVSGGVTWVDNLPDVSLALYKNFYAAGFSSTSPYVVDVVHKKIERKFRKDFVNFMSSVVLPRSGPDAMWHLYSGGNVGVNASRLFNTVAEPYDGGLAIYFKYLPETKLTTVDPRLTQGNGKVVKSRKYGTSKKKFNTQRYKFIMKASVIDTGQTVGIKPKKAKYLAFIGKSRVVKSSYTTMDGKRHHKSVQQGPHLVFARFIQIDYSKKKSFGIGSRSFEAFYNTMGQQLASSIWRKQTRAIKKASKAPVLKGASLTQQRDFMQKVCLAATVSEQAGNV